VPQGGLGGRRIALTTGRGLGGGSSINAMGWFHGHPVDYDGWRDQGADEWGWSDILPYLRRSEDHELGSSEMHGSGGPMVITGPQHLHPLSVSFVQAGVERGLVAVDDLDGPEHEGVGLAHSNVRDGARHSVVDGYLRPARARENLVVRTGVRVDRVLLEGDRAVGIQAEGHQPVVVRARRSVVLSAGAIRTPQLLMLSGIGPAAHLREHGIDVVVDAPGVGSNLHDHPLVATAWPILAADTLRDRLYDDPEGAYRLLRRGPLSALGQGVAVTRSGPGLLAPDLHLAMGLRGVDAGGAALPEAMVSCVVGLLTPLSRGTVRLVSPDPREAPAVDPRYLTLAEDRDRLRAGVRQAIELFSSPSLRAVTGPSLVLSDGADDAELDAFLEQTAGTYWHPVGTARMGTDAGAVVSPRLAVHGVDGLHVVDGSVIPTITRANTQAPIVGIAERAADLLRGAV